MFFIVEAAVAVWEALVSNRTPLGCLVELLAVAVIAAVVFILVG